MKEKIVFTAKKLKEAIEKSKKNDVIIFDEANEMPDVSGLTGMIEAMVGSVVITNMLGLLSKSGLINKEMSEMDLKDFAEGLVSGLLKEFRTQIEDKNRKIEELQDRNSKHYEEESNSATENRKLREEIILLKAAVDKFGKKAK